jgi:trimeric autotransporter adhesin
MKSRQFSVTIAVLFSFFVVACSKHTSAPQNNSDTGQYSIKTIIGGGTADSGATALKTLLKVPLDVAYDAVGNFYVADLARNSVLIENPNDIVNVLVGGNYGFSGDGGYADTALINQPTAVAVDASGNVYFSDSENNRIRKITPGGIITTFADNMFDPAGLTFDGSGTIYVAGYGNEMIYKIDATGIATRIAGTGEVAFAGDGGPATAATLNGPSAVAIDAAGNILIADAWNNRIRKINTAGIISTIAGNGTAGFSGDGGPATSAALNQPTGVAVDAAGNIYIADYTNNKIRMVDTTGTITTFAGNGDGSAGNCGLPCNAGLSAPHGVKIDNALNTLYIADAGNARVLQVNLK